MDKIGPVSFTPRESDAARNAAQVGATGEPSRTQRPETTRDQVQIDSAARSSRSADKDFIITADDARKLDDVKKLISQTKGSRVKASLDVISGISARLDPESGVMEKIRKLGPGVNITPDGEVSSPDPVKKWPGFIRRMLGMPNVYHKTLNLDKIWDQGINGKGVGIAIIDTGIAPHPDLADRIVGFKDFVNGYDRPYDDQGHGTHCAGIAAGSGADGKGKYIGAAPGANLVGVKVMNSSGSGKTSDIIRGIQWAIENKDKYNIKVINLSLGGRIQGPHQQDPKVQAVEAAIKSGITVMVAAGNEGPFSQTVSSPGNAPHAVTVGASDDRGTVKAGDDKLAYFSSRGPTRYDQLSKPDLLAPGTNIIAADNDRKGYVMMSGTSMATPLTAGVAALLIQKNPNATPFEIRSALMNTADPMPNRNALEQGQGVIDPLEAMTRIMEKPE